MRILAIGALCGAIAVQACVAAPATPPPQQEGWQIYQDSHIARTVSCAQQPVWLGGDHTDFTLNGACGHVRVAGDHNDIMIQVGPAATIEITGGHNDVTWQQVVAGPPPHLADNGISNTFHHTQ
jgi:Protein of unknown function (DUF3060)